MVSFLQRPMQVATEQTSREAHSCGVFANTGARSEKSDSAGAARLSELLAAVFSWCVARTDNGVAEGPVPIDVVRHFGICPSRMPPRSLCRVRSWYLARCSSLRGHYSQYGSSTACTRVLSREVEERSWLEVRSTLFHFSRSILR